MNKLPSIFKKYSFLVLFICSLFFGLNVFAQNNPTEVIPPVIAPTGTPVIGSYTGNCDPSKDKDCYQFLEALPTSEGDLTSVSTAPKKDQTGLGGFIMFAFEIGVGIAGVLGVVMLTIYGFQYAANDKNIATFEVLKEKITKVILGLLLLLGIFVILNTINPDLLIVEPQIDEQTLNVISRNDDLEFVKNVESVDVSNVSISMGDYNDTAFLMYLTHQQGLAGGSSILWAAKKGYSSVPIPNPFIKTIPSSKYGGADMINRNMRSNAPLKDYQKVTGQTNITPVGFLNYWSKKTKGFKTKIGTIPQTNADAVQQASTRTGVDVVSLKAVCMIESYNCTKANAVSGGGKGSYFGLFQLGDAEFKKFGEGGSIFDPYKNAYAGARYGKYNLEGLAKNKSKI
jgi:hypothetical protein